MDLVVATRSPNKGREIRCILECVPDLRVLDLAEAGVTYHEDEERLEPYDTFEENAASKARYYQALTGLATVADDSGLAVDALGGAPGVRSKRFAPRQDLDGQARDDENNRHLLEVLAGVPEERRGARYVCVAALVSSDGEEAAFRGEAPGRILTGGRGEGGFGYDPLFLDTELGRTFAELTSAEKNERSHRGRAFRALARHLRGRA